MKGDFYLFLARYAEVFALVLVRVAFFVGFLPILGSRMVPLMVKAATALVLALIMTPLALGKAKVPQDVWAFLLAAAPEALLGMALAFFVRLIFAGVQFGGQLLGFQMGFGVANVIDPATGVQAPVLSQLAYLLALLLFLLFDMHHFFLWGLGESFKALPLGALRVEPSLFDFLVRQGEVVFSLGLKLMAPALAILLLIQIALGIVTRFVPQINVMIVSFPLTIGVGLFFFGLTLQILGDILAPAYGRAVGFMPYVMKFFKG